MNNKAFLIFSIQTPKNTPQKNSKLTTDKQTTSTEMTKTNMKSQQNQQLQQTIMSQARNRFCIIQSCHNFIKRVECLLQT